MLMLGKIFAVICIVSVIFGIVCGNVSELGTAAIDGAADAVQLTISLAGIMGLWCGIMNVLKGAGAIEKLSKLISPFLKIFFPTAYKTGNGIDEISASISANLLGIGNAATPFALSAMKKMQLDNKKKDTATDDMITLTVLNASSFNLIPTTLIALRRSAGSAHPYLIIPAVWITSFLCALLSLVLSRAFASVGRRR